MDNAGNDLRCTAAVADDRHPLPDVVVLLIPFSGMKHLAFEILKALEVDLLGIGYGANGTDQDRRPPLELVPSFHISEMHVPFSGVNVPSCAYTLGLKLDMLAQAEFVYRIIHVFERLC